MRLVLTCFLLVLFHTTHAASVSESDAIVIKQEKERAATASKAYLKSVTNAFALKGFESFMGRKLSKQERRVWKKMQNNTLSPEEEAAMQRNKRLGNWSMIMGIAGVVLSLFPVAGILSILLLPAALITGIIGISRAKKFNNQPGSGFGSSLAGTILGGLFLAILVVAVLLLIAFGL